MSERERREELVNALTHGLGVFASLIGGLILIDMAISHGDGWRILSAAVFAGSLVLLYAASTLYHAARRQALRARLQIVDHCAIFVLIAGTYTPFTLVSLRESLGWWLFGVVWGLAGAGMIFKLFYTGRLQLLSTLIYIAMGWLAVVVIEPLLSLLPTSAILWLLAGGISYTAGTLFYHNRRIPYAHAIWHLFVLVGSTCHFIAVTSQIAPLNMT